MLMLLTPRRLRCTLLILTCLAAGISSACYAKEKGTAAVQAEATNSDSLSVADDNQVVKVESLADLPAKLIIGATAIVREAQSQLLLRARVDTGAASCSIHCKEWEIKEEADAMEENIGKEIRILISNEHDQTEWVESRIDRCVIVKTSETREMRYKVPITLRWKDFEKEVSVTLDNRGKMDYPLLLGRNFLSGTFLVDIDSEHDERTATSK